MARKITKQTVVDLENAIELLLSSCMILERLKEQVRYEGHKMTVDELLHNSKMRDDNMADKEQALVVLRELGVNPRYNF